MQIAMAHSMPTSPATTLIELVRGYQVSRALHAAAVLRLADHIGDAPRSVEYLAGATGTHAGALRRLMRALASRGVLVEFADDRYDVTAMGRLMRSDVPGSVLGQLLLWGHPMQWGPWGELLHSVRTGEPAFDRVHGMGHWDYLRHDAEAGAMFGAAQASHPSHREVPAACDFAGLAWIVDVGGGNGRLLGEILRTHPRLRGTLVDRPEMVREAAASLEAAGVAGRCELIGADFFQDLPEGADAYVLSNVLMDWSDGDALRLLRRCRHAMTAASRLIVVERVVPADNSPTLSQLGDLMGLVITGGCMRREDELAALLAAAGLAHTGAIGTPSGYTILEARPRPRRIFGRLC
jgi:hypothetical protein